MPPPHSTVWGLGVLRRGLLHSQQRGSPAPGMAPCPVLFLLAPAAQHLLLYQVFSGGRDRGRYRQSRELKGILIAKNSEVLWVSSSCSLAVLGDGVIPNSLCSSCGYESASALLLPWEGEPKDVLVCEMPCCGG